MVTWLVKKKKFGRVEYFQNNYSEAHTKFLPILTKHFSISKAPLLSLVYVPPNFLESTPSLCSDTEETKHIRFQIHHS